MAFDEALADRIRKVIGGRAEVTEKKMFGGIAFMWLGKMLVGVMKDELMVRLGPDGGAAALRERHVRTFDFTGKPLKGFVMVAAEVVWDVEVVRRWVDRALVFVGPLASEEGQAMVERKGKQGEGEGSAEVDAYIARWPEPTKKALTKLRGMIRKALPEAVEGISYGLPTYTLGKHVIGFGGAAKHCAIYPMSGSVIEQLSEALAAYSTSKGTIRFAPETGIPAALLKRIIKARLAEIAAT